MIMLCMFNYLLQGEHITEGKENDPCIMIFTTRALVENLALALGPARTRLDEMKLDEKQAPASAPLGFGVGAPSDSASASASASQSSAAGVAFAVPTEDFIEHIAPCLSRFFFSCTFCFAFILLVLCYRIAITASQLGSVPAGSQFVAEGVRVIRVVFSADATHRIFHNKLVCFVFCLLILFPFAICFVSAFRL